MTEPRLRDNPWVQKHLSAERVFSRHLPGPLILKMVERDNDPSPAPLTYPCECGETAWYRGTVGAWQCPVCGLTYAWAEVNR